MIPAEFGRKMVHMDTPTDRGAALDKAAGDELRALRTKRRLTRPALAEQAGLSLRTLQRIESGERSASMRELDALVRVLGVTPRAFVSAVMDEVDGVGEL